MGTRARFQILILVTLLAGACGRSRPSAPEPVMSVGRCPVPMQVSATDPRPLGVRIRNERPDTVWVYLDRCDGSVWVGDIGPETVRAFPLRPPLVPFGNGLRFHLHPRGRLDEYFAAALPVDTARVLELTIPSTPSAACVHRVYVDGEPFAGGLRDNGLDRITGIRMVYAAAGIEAGDGCPSIHVQTHAARGGAPSR
jgi:hypothetical protein